MADGGSRLMMINCKKASQLSSESQERALTFWERLRLRFHCRMCVWCGGHDTDIKAVREACRHEADDESPTEELSPQARERIMKLVREHLDSEQ